MADRLTSGQSLAGIPSKDWNQFCDAVDKIRTLKQLSNPPGATYSSLALSVQVENITEADIDVDFPVLAIDGPVFNTDDRPEVIRDTISLKGKTPVSVTTDSGIVIVQGPIKDGGFRNAVFRGLTWVRVEWTDEDHTHATVKTSENEKLTSAASGIEIVWHEEIPPYEYLPADLWCVVNLGAGGGGGGVTNLAIGRVDNPNIDGNAAEQDEEDPPNRTPGDVLGVTSVQGSAPSTTWKNWSLVDIPEGAFCIAAEIDGDMHILTAFC